MNWKKYDRIKWNGRCWRANQILNDDPLSHIHTNFEHQVFQFLKKWFADDDELIFRTSGSTGTPKEISFHKNQCIASAILTIKYFQLSEGQTVCLALPVRYVAGKMMIIRAIVGGLDLITVEPSSIPDVMERNVDFIALTPMQLTSLFREYPEKAYLPRTTILGGSVVSQALVSLIRERRITAFETYGMTETLTHIAIRQLYPHYDSSFMALQGIGLDTDENDCLKISAPHLGSEPIVTNDIIKFRGKRSFEVLGRRDNIINSGGVKINPEVLEKKLADYISDPFLFLALPDENLGERLILVIEKSNFKSDEMETIEKNVCSLLKGFEKPKEILYLAEFSKTPTGKLERNKIIEQILEKRS